MQNGNPDTDTAAKLSRIKDGDYDALKSAIPDHLLITASAAERHMIATVSILDQRTNMLRNHIGALDANIGELEAREAALRLRIAFLEGFANKLKSFWVVIIAMGAALTFVFELIKFVWSVIHK